MSALDALLNPKYSEKTVDVVITDRFIDPETNEPVKFCLRTLKESEKAALRKQSIVTRNVDGNKYNEVDNQLFLAKCIIEACVSPDLKSAELSKKYGPIAPDAVLKEMLIGVEYERLAKAFMQLNVMDDDSIDFGEVTKK